jgi:hypothetical protein
METMKTVCEAALATKQAHTMALLLDVMLCEAEEKLGLLDGIPVEDWKEEA